MGLVETVVTLPFQQMNYLVAAAAAVALGHELLQEALTT